MKRMSVVLAVFVTALAAFALAASAAAPQNGTLVIKHLVKGCHSWSLNGGKLLVVQNIHLAKGGSLVIQNFDVMPHQVVKTSGPAMIVKLVKPGTMGMGMMNPPFARGMMGRMGATVKVTFPAAGVYKLTTKVGEDYMEGMKTIGEDHVLRAVVTVS
jgi:hypothetical protein